MDKEITVKEAKALKGTPLLADGSIRIADVGRGKRILSYEPYIHPLKSAKENFEILSKMGEEIRKIFPSYESPTLRDIENIIAGRLLTERDVLKDGEIAEREIPSPFDAMLKFHCKPKR